jgi:hypothetical protein
MTLTVRSASVTGATTAARALTHAEMDANWAHVIESSNQNFTPSGSATSRTVQDKLRDIKDVRDWGVTTSDSVANQTTKIQEAIDDIPAGTELHINEAYTVTGLTITDKTDIKITGRGGLTLSGASVTAKIFDLVGTIDNLTIEGLELVGENNSGATYFQQAIGNASGQTKSNVWFVRNKISNINAGISLNAEQSGTYTKAHVLNNSFTNMVGTLGGQGYGTHLAKATLSEVCGNVYDNCSRHAIYHARGENSGNVIAFNRIKNHRSSVFDASIRTAINIHRSGGVIVAYNINESGYDGGINIGHDTSESENCTDIEVIGNTFRNRQNLVSDMYIGENSVPTDYTTTHVRVKGNTFFNDESVSGDGGAAITIYNGRYVEISGNSFRKTNVDATTTFIVYGSNAAMSITADFTDCSVTGNSFVAEGSSLTDTRAISLVSEVSTGTSSHRFDNRNHVNITQPVRHGTTPTNPNIMAISENRCRVLGAGAGVADGTTAGKAKTTVAVKIASSRAVTARAATDDFWDLTGVATGAGEFCKVLLCVDDGSSAVILKGEEAASQGAAKLPRLPDTTWAALGVVEIGESYSGGDLSGNTFYDIVGEYEQ